MDQAQRLFYEANGFLTLPQALSGTALDNVRAAADRAEARWRDNPTRPGARSAVLEQVQAPIEYEDELLELLWHPAVFPLVREIVGNDIQMIDKRLFHHAAAYAEDAHGLAPRRGHAGRLPPALDDDGEGVLSPERRERRLGRDGDDTR
jgi:hypothetical protein